MRRGYPDEPYEGDGEMPRRSRVIRLADIPEEPRRSERRGSRPLSPAPGEGGGVGSGRPSSPLGTEAVSPTILSVTPEGDGDRIAVVLAIPSRESSDGEGVRAPKKPRRLRVCLLVEQYAALRAEGISLECGDISETLAARLTDEGELCEAIRRGLSALQYGDRSAHRLIRSLTAKGISRERAEAAASYLIRKGFIREEDTARRRVGCGLRKGWGPRRIREDLRLQGLESEAVEAAMEELSSVDFGERCAEVIQKKYGKPPRERGERQRMTAALLRLGYDLDQVRWATRRLEEEP